MLAISCRERGTWDVVLHTRTASAAFNKGGRREEAAEEITQQKFPNRLPWALAFCPSLPSPAPAPAARGVGHPHPSTRIRMAAPVSSALDSAWQAVVVDNFTELQVATVVTFLLHETVFFLSGLPFLVFERFGLLAKYKIQVRALFYSVCYLMIISFSVNQSTTSHANAIRLVHAPYGFHQ
jgi:hypothetical protein